MEDGPDFFIIGAQKAGTTRLSGLLNRHPEIGIPRWEPMFFQSPAAMAAKGARYREIIAGLGPARVRGERSTYYSMRELYPGTAERIKLFNPAAKIIYIVRHPLRRIESAWVQLLSVGHANSFRGFDWTVRNTELLLGPTRYWAQLSEYRRHFPDSQVLVLFFEDFIVDELATARDCFAFLGVDASVRVELAPGEMRHASEGKRQRAAVVDMVRALPRYDSVKAFVPLRLKRFFTHHFTRPVPAARWRPATLAWVADQLSEDTAALLRHTGRPPGYWPMPVQ
jgi:hypothetical protein